MTDFVPEEEFARVNDSGPACRPTGTWRRFATANLDAFQTSEFYCSCVKSAGCCYGDWTRKGGQVNSEVLKASTVTNSGVCDMESTRSLNMSQVEQFYAGQNIFITGVTGFLGRILLEKLLRCCPEIGTIYVLIRVKKGKNAEERIDALLVDPVFDVVRRDYPDFSNKVVGVTGNIAADGLDLSPTDHARIVNEVSVIFHLAATVRFNEKLDTAIAINVNSVKYIVDIAKACKNFKVGIYVSTAFSHCVRKSINEELYPPPLSYEGVNKLMRDVGKNKSKWSEEEMQNFTERVLGEWPNTYSFTKAIAEGVIAEYAKDMPFAVFRPSIVMNAYREPIPGWVAEPLGVPGLMCAIVLGVMHVALLDLHARTDIVPVDYVCNALISSAWDTAMTKKRHHAETPVYNYVSGNENPVTWKQLHDRLNSLGRLYPSNTSVYYPSGFWTKSRRVFFTLEFFFHSIPALIIDSAARLSGKQPRLYKLARKVRHVSRALAYFSTQQWDFENQRTQNLWKRMRPTDQRTFPFNMRDVDWDEHTMKMVKGLRKYIFAEPDGNDKQARRRHVYLYIIHMMVCLAFGMFILWMIWVVLHGFGFTFGMDGLTA